MSRETRAARGFARSAAMQDALRGLEAALENTGGVLLRGERGCGRDLFARAIHLAGGSARREAAEALLRQSMRGIGIGRPFVVVDCGHRDALEERLFGLEAPAGDGIGLERISAECLLRAGFGGTVVFRQVGEMPARLQLRLARLLRDGEVMVAEAAGAARVQQVGIRPVATAGHDGRDGMVPELQQRMSQTVIVVPPLRSRREDIPGLVRVLLADICAAAGVPGKAVSNQAIDLLAALPWRGNVGELETLLRRLVRKTPGRQIRLAHVLAHVRLDGQSGPAYTGTLRQAREQFERDYVRAALDEHRGRMAEAARALGLQRTNLYRKVRQLSVGRDSLARQLS